MGILQKIFGNKEQEDIDDDKTTDSYLRSLRRQRRVQLEEIEKENLKNDIREHEKMRTREVVLGTGMGDTSSNLKIQKIQTKIEFLKKSPKKRMKKGKPSFLSKGNI